MADASHGNGGGGGKVHESDAGGSDSDAPLVVPASSLESGDRTYLGVKPRAPGKPWLEYSFTGGLLTRWLPPVPGVVDENGVDLGYRVQYDVQVRMGSLLRRMWTTVAKEVPTPQFMAMDLKPGAEYYVRVRAVSLAGAGPWSLVSDRMRVATCEADAQRREGPVPTRAPRGRPVPPTGPPPAAGSDGAWFWGGGAAGGTSARADGRSSGATADEAGAGAGGGAPAVRGRAGGNGVLNGDEDGVGNPFLTDSDSDGEAGAPWQARGDGGVGGGGGGGGGGCGSGASGGDDDEEVDATLAALEARLEQLHQASRAAKNKAARRAALRAEVVAAAALADAREAGAGGGAAGGGGSDPEGPRNRAGSENPPPSSASVSRAAADATAAAAGAAAARVRLLEQALSRETARRKEVERDNGRLRGEAAALADLSILDLEQLQRRLEDALRRVRDKKEELEKLDADTTPDKDLCVICSDAPKTILLLPCRHVALCGPCNAMDTVTECPLCRTRIEESMRVFT